MSSRKKSRSSHAQRVLYTKKGIRRKIYKNISKTLIEQGVEKSRIDEVIEQIKKGRIKLINPSLMKDIDTLTRLDADIKRLQEQVDNEKESTTQQPGE
ncbi:MAG: hypothetical protein IKD36_00735 [Clostridia bacterium]|nr:hypothetical protein [Clostridia bacterium]